VRYRLGLEVVAMGDTNAVDIANECHRSVLRESGCLDPSSEVVYGWVFPAGPIYEGVYIDDHFVLAVVPRGIAGRAEGEDYEIVRRSHGAYERSKMRRAEEKGYGFAQPPDPETGQCRGAQHFTVLGTEVASDPGLAGTATRKRGELMILGLQAAALPYTEKDMFRRCLSLFTYPFMHRRCLMSALQSSFRWCDGLEPGQATRWDPEIKDELAAAVLMLPVAQACLRWPVASRLVATDATPTRGGTAATYISESLALQLYRFTEQKGGHVRLQDDGQEDAEGRLLTVFPEIRELTGALRWHATRSALFRHLEHIHAQELEEVLRELRSLVGRTLAPQRVLTAQDNTVLCVVGGKADRGRVR